MAPPSSPGFRAPGPGARGMLAHLSSKIGLVSERPPSSWRGEPPSAGVPPSTRAGDRERHLGTRQVGGLHQGGGRPVVVNHIDAVMDVDARAHPSIPRSPSELTQAIGEASKRREEKRGREENRKDLCSADFFLAYLFLTSLIQLWPRRLSLPQALIGSDPLPFSRRKRELRGSQTHTWLANFFALFRVENPVLGPRGLRPAG